MTFDDAFRNNLIEGSQKFQSARFNAFWQDMFGLMRGKSTELLSFDDIRARLRLREEFYKGLQEVPVDQIVGSVGRYRDFTSSFLPKKNNMRDRWSRVYAHVTGSTGLPPVELYKIGDVYFVRDGNHRVSVARQIGAKTIEAHVTELPTEIPLRPGMSEEELDSATAYAAFLAETGLSHTRQHHQPLNLSERSRYADLLGHIYTHRAFIQQVRGTDLTVDEAAADWYDNIYRPAVTLVRKYNILSVIPGRTEADLYLWIVDHLNDMREQYGDSAPRKFSQAMIDFLEKRKIPVPEDLTQEQDTTLKLDLGRLRQAIADQAQDADSPEGRDPDADLG
jgi:hypothetical protein